MHNSSYPKAPEEMTGRSLHIALGAQWIWGPAQSPIGPSLVLQLTVEVTIHKSYSHKVLQ